MAAHSSVLAWEAPWAEELGKLRSTEPQSDMTKYILLYFLIHQSSPQHLCTRILPGKPVLPTPTAFHGILNEVTSLSPFEESHSYQKAFKPLYLKYWNVRNILFNKTPRELSYCVKVCKTLLELIGYWHKLIKIVLSQKKMVIFFFLLTWNFLSLLKEFGLFSLTFSFMKLNYADY